ncbi:MAG TPA: hypothetical protein VN109_12085 [Devosia sp.]|nr:hypothetical protein [Devosia sp.]
MLLDENKSRTHKNKQQTAETKMLTFLKDAMALMALCGFTGAAIAWMDMASRLVV